jgi:hypothetical protein
VIGAGVRPPPRRRTIFEEHPLVDTLNVDPEGDALPTSLVRGKDSALKNVERGLSKPHGTIVLSTVLILFLSAPVAMPVPRWKTFRNGKFGFQLKYPATHRVEASGGHSPLAHPEYLARFSILPNAKVSPTSPRMDIDVASGRQFTSERDFVETEFDGRLRLEGTTTLAGSIHTLYSFQGYHFVFIRHGRYILSFSSPTKQFLLALTVTLRLTVPRPA